MFSKMLRTALCIFLTILASELKAQPLLPDIAGTTERGVNIISWSCQYDGIKSIAVQRSRDSAYNYVTTGYVKNLKKGVQAFIDGHPAPGNNWYRLYIVFNSDLTWYSNRINLRVDSMQLMKQDVVLPPNDSLQKIITTNGNDSMQKIVRKIAIKITSDESEINPLTYIKSQYIFTNPLTGHVNMELPEVKEHKYSVKFFNQKDQLILEVPRVAESPVIIDKRNFQNKGFYKFILKRDNSQFETGYISIY
jgi:hypothetical protein